MRFYIGKDNPGKPMHRLLNPLFHLSWAILCIGTAIIFVACGLGFLIVAPVSFLWRVKYESK